MVMRPALATLVFVALAACDGTLPDPRIESITPNEITQGEAPSLTVQTNAVFPYSVDYGSESAEVVPRFVLRIGTAPLDAARLNGDGSITGGAPFGLPAGTYDVTLELSDGRNAARYAAFVVKPGVFPDGFTIDPIADQVRGQPFAITLRAYGANAAAFTGSVQFSASYGTVMPSVSGPFQDGVRTEQITLTTPSDNMILSVTDAAGHIAQSNAFRVTY